MIMKNITKITFWIYLILSNKNLFNTLSINIAHNSLPKLIFYSLVSVIFFFLFYCFLSIKSLWKRISLCSLFLISSFIAQTFSDISGNTININDIEIALININSWANFLNQYKNDLISNLLIMLVGIFSIFNYQKINNFLFFKKYLIQISVLFFITIFSISFSRGGFGTQGLPSQLQVFIPLPFLGITNSFEFKKEDYAYIKPKNNNVVLIIDESISYKYFKKALSINTSQNEIFSNIKKFYSLHNCSAQSVFSIINGIQYIGENLLLRENLWSMAKKNGYRTVYISGQEKENQYQYLQSPSELMLIDEKFFFGNEINSKRDNSILIKLTNLLRTSKKQFIVVIKNGSHFPYYDQFDISKYKLDKNNNLQNVYLYSIKENSIDFLKKLISEIDRNSEILYLSDHGQYFNDKKLSHCNSFDPNIEEWEIPLLNYSKKSNEIKISSNLHIYDLIAEKMGYYKVISSSMYNLLFYGNIHTRFGHKPKFKKVK